MTATVTTIPTYPMAGREFKLIVSASDGNFVRVNLTACPTEATDWYARLRSGSVGQIKLAESDASKEIPITFPVGGTYALSIEELTRGATRYGGSYLDDPDSYDTLTLVATTTTTLKIGQRLSVQLGSAGDTAKLVLCVWDTYCRATTEQYHGEATPKIVEWSSAKAKLAALDSYVITQATNMANETCSNIVGSTSDATLIDELITKFVAHLSQATVHANNDSDNVIKDSFKVGASVSVERKAAALAEIRTKLKRHMTNDKGEGAGSAASVYHTAADNKRAPIADGSSDQRSVMAELADLRRVYLLHIAEGTTIHANADTTNTLTAAGPLLAIHQYFFAQLGTTAPTVPATEQSGVVTMVSGGGFEKA